VDLGKVVEIKELHFKYPDGKEALKGVSLIILEGESVGIIGPNGAGKSTLLLHLNGLLQGQNPNGRVSVWVRGLPVDSSHLREIRRLVGLVFQDPDDQLFSPTVFDDVAFGPVNLGLPPHEVKERVRQALAWMGLEGYEERSPHHLSLGEKKRVAIAAVLSMKPYILALDEPTANLDPRGRWELIELLRRLPQTKIIASHDLGMVRALCNRVVVLDKGEVVADGPAETILEDHTLLKEHGLAPLR